MKLSQIKRHLQTTEAVNFKLEDGTYVPENFHVTEVGVITKNFIDCGGTVRKETVANFQLWDADDYQHRLKPNKLLKIISLSEDILGMGDHEIEVEYQTGTVGKYDLDFDGTDFVLLAKKTACLAQEQCGVPAISPVAAGENDNENSRCTPGGGCC